MTVKDSIIARLTSGLAPSRLDVVDESHLHAGHSGSRPEGETHFRVRVTSAAFAARGRVERHRMVNALLEAELRGPVHALALDLKAPGEAGS